MREAFTALLGEIPDAAWEVPTAEKSRVRDGVYTFVFRDGLIRVQTVHYTPESAT